MRKTNLQVEWLNVAEKMHLDVIAPFFFQTKNGELIQIEVLLRGYGARNGMLIVSDFEKIEPYLKEIADQGFGFSTLSEPEKPDLDIESFKEVLDDWGKI